VNSKSLHVESRSEEETSLFASRLAELVRPGDVLRLNGPLGAGKTRLVQGLAASLGCTADFVASPTFTLVHEYDGPLPVFHVDAYRLRDSDEFQELGGEELMNLGGVLCVEWAERIADLLPSDSLAIQIDVTGETSRRFELSAEEGRGAEIIASIRSTTGDSRR